MTGPDPLARPLKKKTYKNKLKIKKNQIVLPLKGLLHTFYVEFYLFFTDRKHGDSCKIAFISRIYV